MTETGASRQPSADSDSRPTKRARKAVNCDPCRQSKLKCDRARPCSGCVLRGSVALCYPNERPDNAVLASDERPSTSDIQTEISRIRQSLAVIEAHFSRMPGSPPTQFQISPHSSMGPMYDEPSLLGNALAMLNNEGNSEEQSTNTSGDHDSRNQDLITLLPEDPNTIEALFSHYFENGTWIYRYVDQQFFWQSWASFKQSGRCSNLTLAIFFTLLAISLQYIPSRHKLLSTFSDPPIVLSSHYYALANSAYGRHKASQRVMTLELMEFLLIKIHFLNISNRECEEIWTLRTEAVSSATAMGLHRDPADSNMPREVIERRRWIWWNIMGIERWQAFLFGRPPGIANKHCSTQFPVESCAQLDANGPAHAGSFHLHCFRFIHLLGDILDTTVSLRPISYDQILAHDRELEDWLRNIPPAFDPRQLAPRFSLSSDMENNRWGLQTLYLKGALFHVRFTLHRPYTTPTAQEDPRLAPSFDTAVSYAQKLITLYAKGIGDFFDNIRVSVPGNISQGPLHLFAASSFLCSQLMSCRTQPDAEEWKGHIQDAMDILRKVQPIAPSSAKGLAILNALAPMLNERYGVNIREENKCDYYAIVRQLTTTSTFDVVDIPPPAVVPPSVQPTRHSPLSYNTNREAIPPLPPPQQYVGGYPLITTEDVLWSAALGLDSGSWQDFPNLCGPRLTMG